MNFSTVVPIIEYEKKIDYNSKILSIGSCFAVNMSQKFDYYKFQNSCNPFGILFHPLAIEKLFQFVIDQKIFSSTDFIFHQDCWHSFDAHSEKSKSNLEELILDLNRTIEIFFKELQEASHIIITYGTAWVYRNLLKNEIVANCHKLAQKEFRKEILSIDNIQKSIENSISLVKKINPNIQFIFSISPVRHIKDGFVGNQQSKAHLITALHSVMKASEQNLNYFPSYEIMMDELRDYRFYDSDMLHPSPIAIDYIWERFMENYIDKKEHHTMIEINRIQTGLMHRPFNPNTESHLNFLEQLESKKIKIKNQYPHIRF